MNEDNYESEERGIKRTKGDVRHREKKKTMKREEKGLEEDDESKERDAKEQKERKICRTKTD